MFEVVGTATGQKWFSYADDLIFAAIDAGGGNNIVFISKRKLQEV